MKSNEKKQNQKGSIPLICRPEDQDNIFRDILAIQEYIIAKERIGGSMLV